MHGLCISAYPNNPSPDTTHTRRPPRATIKFGPSRMSALDKKKGRFTAEGRSAGGRRGGKGVKGAERRKKRKKTCGRQMRDDCLKA